MARYSNFDLLLHRHIGPLGPWQWLIFWVGAVSYSIPLINYHQLAMLSNPGFCRQPVLAAYNWSAADVANLTKPPASDFMNCVEYNLTALWPHLDANTSVEEAIGLRDDLYGHNASSLPQQACADRWTPMPGQFVFRNSLPRTFRLNCRRIFLISTSNVVGMVTMMAGQTACGFLADRFGRQRVGFVTGVVSFFCVCLITLAPNFWVYLVVRSVALFFTNSHYLVMTIHWTETTDGRHRPLLMAVRGVYYSVVSNGLLALSGFLLQDWRFLLLVIVVPTSATFLYPCLVPESPRWLLANSRYAEADRVIETAIRLNRGPQAIARYREDSSGLLREGDGGASQLSGDSPSIVRLLVSDGAVRSRFLAMLAVWVGVSVVYFCLPFYAVRLPLTPYLMSYMSALSSIPGFLIHLLCYRLFRRKYPLIGMLITTAAFCFAIAFCLTRSSRAFDVAAIVSATAAAVGSNAIFGMILVYSPEIFPTHCRSTIIGLLVGCSKLGAAVGMFVERLDAVLGRSAPPLVFGAFCLASAFACLVLPNTSGLSMVELDVEEEATGKPQRRPSSREE